MNIKKWIGASLFFTCLYTLLFFSVSNYFHWYFNREFLYAELIGEASYYMYNWLGNLLTTISMSVIIFIAELIRSRASYKQ
jgi:hypothetical protein